MKDCRIGQWLAFEWLKLSRPGAGAQLSRHALYSASNCGESAHSVEGISTLRGSATQR